MPTIVPIHDAEDPRIAAFRDIRERDLIGREGRFIAEGEVVLRVLIERSPHRAEAVLIAANRVGKLGPLLARLPPHVPVHVAPQPVLDRIAGFHLHRGILALGAMAPAVTPAALLAGLGRRALVVVLVGIANHDNMGGIFRNAAAFGVAAVLVDHTCCDPFYRKALRVSVGAGLIVPFARLAPGDDPIALLGAEGFASFALSPGGATELAELRRPPRAAVLLGAEGPGLPPAILARARSVRISMSGGFDSLNVATTSGIVLYHLACAARPADA